MRVCIESATGRLIEAQSNDDAPLDALIANALSAGYTADTIDARVVDDATYQLLLNPPAPPPTLSDLKAAACARIEAYRLALEQAGVWINWPNGTRSKIQTRDERDWRNINGVASRGLARLTQNLTDEDWFRDADNVDHALLPSQALDLGYQASAAISIIARVAQVAKDAINADTVTTAEQVAAIEAGVVWP